MVATKNGEPEELSKLMIENPKRYLRRHLHLIGDVKGNYFDDKLFYGNVAYKTQFPENEQQDFPDCLLRYYTLGEIVTAIAQAGLRISELIETPREDEHKNLPISFTLVAYKDNFHINTRQ